MSSPKDDRVELLQGNTRPHRAPGAGHDGPPARVRAGSALEQTAGHRLTLNQGTLYHALVRLEQKGWIKGTWQRTATNREAKYYDVTRAGRRGIEKETERWLRLVGLVNKLLTNEPS